MPFLNPPFSANKPYVFNKIPQQSFLMGYEAYKAKKREINDYLQSRKNIFDVVENKLWDATLKLRADYYKRNAIHEQLLIQLKWETLNELMDDTILEQSSKNNFLNWR